MTFNKFYIKLFIILIFVSAFGALTIWSFHEENLVLSRYIIACIWFLFIFLFFRHIRNTTIIIKEFITNIKEGDLVFLPNSRNAFGKEFNDLILFLNNKLKNIRIEKEEQYHLFTTAVNQSGSGIIVYGEDGNIELINKSAKDLFKTKNLSNINELSVANSHFPNKLMLTNETSYIISIQAENELQKIAVHQNQFILRGKKLSVASMQNISNELDQEELESWKKLMHVITHEIMNSVTPMKTLAYSLYDIFKKDKKAIPLQELTQQNIEDSFMGLKALNNRVHGLMRFVESYRKLYKIPEPVYTNFPINEIIDEIITLFKDSLNEKSINLNVEGDKELVVFADKLMLTQVFMNLIKNSIESFEKTDNPLITISISHYNNENIISITDNGKGIKEEELKDIFIPFYTTKKDGTGIGLYYSRMVIYMHKGRISVNSLPGRGSTFTIHL